jgi:hypothetical protein
LDIRGTFTCTSSQAVSISGSWYNAGNFNAASSTVTFTSTDTAPLSGWLYRKPINISNTTSTNLYQYQTQITLTTSTFDYTKASSTGADIRFTASDGNQPIPYWIESWSATSNSIIWVKVPSLPANSTTTIYMYYGKSGATSTSDGTSTFEFFDDFLGSSLDINRWTINGTPTVSNSIVTCENTLGGESGNEGIASVPNFGINYSIRAKLKTAHWNTTSYRESIDWGYDFDNRIFIRRYKLWSFAYVNLSVKITNLLLYKLKLYKTEMGSIFKHSPHSFEMYFKVSKEIKNADIVHLHTLPYFHNIIGFLIAKIFFNY